MTDIRIQAPQNNESVEKTASQVDQSYYSQEDDEQRYKSFTQLTFIVITYCLASFYFGYNIVYLGTFNIDNVVKIFAIEIDKNVAFGLLMGCLPVGAAIGSPLSALLMKIFSRKNSVIFINILAIIIVGISMIPNFGVLFFCRIMQGMFVGFYTAQITLIIHEIVPMKIAGPLGSFSQLFVNIGVFVGFLMQYLITQFNSQTQLWRLMFAFMIIPPIVQTILLIFVFNFQTPKYLLQQDQQEECRQLLQIIYKQEFVQEVLFEKKRDLGFIDEKQQPLPKKTKPAFIVFLTHLRDKTLTQKTNENVQGKDNQGPLKSIAEGNKNKADQAAQDKEDQNKNKKDDISVKDQVKKVEQNNQIDHRHHKKFLRRFLSIQLSMLMQFSGIQAYAAYGVLIIQQIFPEYANLIPMLFNLLPIITGLMTACLLARIGRKPILQFGTSFTILALLLTAIGYFIISTEEDNEGAKILILIGYFIFMIMFGLSQGPLIFLYVPQIVDPKFISIATFANWATAAVISISFPILSNAFGTPAPIFTFFAVWCFVSLVFNQKVMVETKGKTEKEIYDEFDEIVSCN